MKQELGFREVTYTNGRPEEKLKCHEVKIAEVGGGGRYGSEGA
jgi:hypothetical protein